MHVSTRSLKFVLDALRAHRWADGTRWQLLSSHRLALVVLVHLRKRETYRDVARGFGAGSSSSTRRRSEACEPFVRDRRYNIGEAGVRALTALLPSSDMSSLLWRTVENADRCGLPVGAAQARTKGCIRADHRRPRGHRRLSGRLCGVQIWCHRMTCPR